MAQRIQRELAPPGLSILQRHLPPQSVILEACHRTHRIHHANETRDAIGVSSGTAERVDDYTQTPQHVALEYRAGASGIRRRGDSAIELEGFRNRRSVGARTWPLHGLHTPPSVVAQRCLRGRQADVCGQTKGGQLAIGIPVPNLTDLGPQRTTPILRHSLTAVAEVGSDLIEGCAIGTGPALCLPPTTAQLRAGLGEAGLRFGTPFAAIGRTPAHLPPELVIVRLPAFTVHIDSGSQHPE